MTSQESAPATAATDGRPSARDTRRTVGRALATGFFFCALALFVLYVAWVDGDTVIGWRMGAH